MTVYGANKHALRGREIQRRCSVTRWHPHRNQALKLNQYRLFVYNGSKWSQTPFELCKPLVYEFALVLYLQCLMWCLTRTLYCTVHSTVLTCSERRENIFHTCCRVTQWRPLTEMEISMASLPEHIHCTFQKVLIQYFFHDFAVSSCMEVQWRWPFRLFGTIYYQNALSVSAKVVWCQRRRMTPLYNIIECFRFYRNFAILHTCCTIL